MAQMVKSLPAMQETQVQFLGWEDHLEKATHSSILAWRISWAEEPGRLQSIGSHRVWHDWVTDTHTHTHTQNGEFDDYNRQEAENMVQMVGMWVDMVKGVCGNSFQIEKIEKLKQLERHREWLIFKKQFRNAYWKYFQVIWHDSQYYHKMLQKKNF